MSIRVNELNWYNKNVLRSFDNWSTLVNAYVVGGALHIRAGGYAGVSLSSDYYNGLNASKYRRVSIEVEGAVNDQYNYKNMIDVVVLCKYKSDDGAASVEGYYSLAVTQLNRDRAKVISMESSDLESCTVLVVNRTDQEVAIASCEMFRSQDVNSSQVGESIGFGITLNKVVAYLDGCEVYYDGVEAPDKLWWQEDEEGNFSGINVNNERLIKFTRKNEILLD